MAELTNKIGGVFNTIYKTGGTGGVDNPIAVAQEIISSLPEEEHSVFMLIRKGQGHQIAWGYHYGYKSYGTLHIEMYNNTTIRVDIVNREFILR